MCLGDVKCLMLPVKSVLHYFKYLQEQAYLSEIIQYFQIQMNIVILVSLLSCALGFHHQVHLIHLHTQYLSTVHLSLTFYHRSWSIAIILNHEFSIVMCIKS